ncbi:Fibrinogen-like protein A [Apostichopus japonicus]|uniref:Fibrinogen-like protein A n=1 Tax=Stichopus japonicus TaxID=307972 RepID=A0A2G8LA71_STIJA|nr:Fibrinogen-like protein A [Apostichopus japonicus]
MKPIPSVTAIVGVMCLQASYAQESSYFVFQQPDYQRDCKEVLNACSSTHNTSGVYLIKPDGYPEPFEVFCDNDLDTGGWTVREFWIGNEKIAFLTNQKQYQLRIEFQNAAGEAYYVTYDNFRISDEWGQFSIASLGTYEGTAESQIEWCPTNQIFSNETCERRCDDPDTCISSTSRTELEKCVCVGDYMIQGEDCIPQNQCSCFVTEKGGVLTDGEIYVNSDCTSRSVCSNNQLIVEESYHCSDDATCDVRDGIRRCYCIDGYEGDGVNCTREVVPKDCQELYVDGSSDGVYTIYPDGWPSGIQVYCEMESNVGGWIVSTMQQHSSKFAHICS